MSELRKLESSKGLIWDGFTDLGTGECDAIAQANDLMYAEQLVTAFDGKSFWIDAKTFKIVKS